MTLGRELRKNLCELASQIWGPGKKQNCDESGVIICTREALKMWSNENGNMCENWKLKVIVIMNKVESYRRVQGRGDAEILLKGWELIQIAHFSFFGSRCCRNKQEPLMRKWTSGKKTPKIFWLWRKTIITICETFSRTWGIHRRRYKRIDVSEIKWMRIVACMMSKIWEIWFRKQQV